MVEKLRHIKPPSEIKKHRWGKKTTKEAHAPLFEWIISNPIKANHKEK